MTAPLFDDRNGQSRTPIPTKYGENCLHITRLEYVKY